MKRISYLTCGVIVGAMVVMNSGRADEDSTESPKSGIDKQHFKLSIKPGDDFYKYVNGTWLDEFEIPADKSNYGSFTGLADDAEKALREIVEATASKKRKIKGSDDQKVGDFYTCIWTWNAAIVKEFDRSNRCWTKSIHSTTNRS